MEDQPREPVVPADFKMAPLISRSLYYDMYRITIAEAVYIAKVFPPARIAHYQRELQILMALDHENIVRPMTPEQDIAAKLANTLKTEVLIFPEASRGSFFQYLQTNGSLSERVARFYTRQVVSALDHAHSNGILHPNLNTENLLLHQNRKFLLCGWSNSLNNEPPILRDILFTIGELILTLCTSRRPFISKESKSDPFAKFLTEAHIHKFWEQIERIMKKTNKSFQFSSEIKELISALFLNKVDSLDAISGSKWAQMEAKEEEVFLEMEEQEKNAKMTKEARRARAQAAQKEEKEMVIGNFAMGLSRKPSRSYDIFQEEYQNCEENATLIEEKPASDRHNYFKLFDQDPRLVISHLRTRLREAERDQQIIVDPLLLLKDFDVTHEKAGLSITCTFGWNFAQLQQNTVLCGFSHQIDLKLFKEGQHLLGRLQAQQSSQLNAECVSRMNHWLLDTLQQWQ